jgi:hypothetical protein
VFVVFAFRVRYSGKYNLTSWGILLVELVISQLVGNSPHSMAPEGFLSFSQQPTAGSYAEPDEPMSINIQQDATVHTSFYLSSLQTT